MATVSRRTEWRRSDETPEDACDHFVSLLIPTRLVCVSVPISSSSIPVCQLDQASSGSVTLELSVSPSLVKSPGPQEPDVKT